MQYFRPGADHPMLESRLRLLEHALKRFDFARLRTAFPALAGGGGSEVAVQPDPDGRIAIKIDGVLIDPY